MRRSSRSKNGFRALIRLLRLVRIFAIAVSYGLHEFMPRVPGDFVLRFLAGRRADPRGQRLREAFERLGPIFVKFGQVLSTRRDLLPPDLADELAQRPDRAPPVCGPAAPLPPRGSPCRSRGAAAAGRAATSSRRSSASRSRAPRSRKS